MKIVKRGADSISLPPVAENSVLLPPVEAVATPGIYDHGVIHKLKANDNLQKHELTLTNHISKAQLRSIFSYFFYSFGRNERVIKKYGELLIKYLQKANNSEKLYEQKIRKNMPLLECC